MPPAIGHDIQLAIGVEVSDGDSVDVRIGVRSERECGDGLKPPLPSPSNTVRYGVPVLAITKSGLPSPLKSPTAMSFGPSPVGIGGPGAR